MPKKIKIPSKRKQAFSDFMLRVATDINGEFTPEDIAKRYINPKTNKPYTREHIYWVIRQINERKITK